jgi:hypothetical protein
VKTPRAPVGRAALVGKRAPWGHVLLDVCL